MFYYINLSNTPDNVSLTYFFDTTEYFTTCTNNNITVTYKN